MTGLASAATESGGLTGAICCMLVVFLIILAVAIFRRHHNPRPYSDFRKPPHR